MNFSRSGRPIIQAEQKNQVAANQLAIMESARAARKQLMKEQLLPQLQANPQLMDMIPTVLQTKEDMDILNELFSEMNTGRGGKRSKKRMTKRRRTLRRMTLRKRRRY
jgi:hypothetical protein